jgi:hypothetical protein
MACGIGVPRPQRAAGAGPSEAERIHAIDRATDRVSRPLAAIGRATTLSISRVTSCDRSRSVAAVKSKSHPKVGIRPTIDGRLGGVRESLEERTMQQARAVAELIAKELRYPDGTPVQCVIADTCIGGVKEAADCAEKLSLIHI